ncbi:hypothetical protein AAFF_G00164000 [Aldrovandia affinis]|uniref:Uncharacterized protein n=1 Tax=Aldrovandia affinis TaxID=143900 RepID=A0AAD7T0L1_9TELE|nr:hypothetical protein AAFF_G00164000 [Aldrovandia affinis]
MLKDLHPSTSFWYLCLSPPFMEKEVWTFRLLGPTDTLPQMTLESNGCFVRILRSAFQPSFLSSTTPTTQEPS